MRTHKLPKAKVQTAATLSGAAPGLNVPAPLWKCCRHSHGIAVDRNFPTFGDLEERSARHTGGCFRSIVRPRHRRDRNVWPKRKSERGESHE
jgi:hypothetical protein